jgi:wobble nucleotide-excising tRNase
MPGDTVMSDMTHQEFSLSSFQDSIRRAFKQVFALTHEKSYFGRNVAS